jgi:signal transduction histidine kinase
MSDYGNMSRAKLIQRLRALEQLDSERRLTEAEERVHLIQSVVEQGFSVVLITGGELVASTETMFGVKCRLVCDPPVVVKDPVAATHLYRIAQEAVSNAIKHGESKNISLQLREETEAVSLRVTDDGTGFPENFSGGTGMGLRIMQTRIGMVDGTLRVEQNPAGGVTVSCHAPKKSGVSHDR